MTIRQKLLVFIPVLVILANMVAFFIYNSSTKIQSSYHNVLNRMMIERQVIKVVEQTTNELEVYIRDRNEGVKANYTLQRNKLEELSLEITKLNLQEPIYIQVKNLYQLVQSYLKLLKQIEHQLSDPKVSIQSIPVAELKQNEQFINDEASDLIYEELNLDQSIYDRILSLTLELNRYGVALFVISVLLSLFVAFWLTESINRPLNKLAVAAQAVASGKLDYPVPEKETNDEIGSLYESFNHMVQNLRELFVKNVENLEKDKLVKELELKALQSQIHPHFMFNTLNVISKLAYIEGAERASELAVSVSNLFRYNLRRLDQPVMLRDELQNATEYFAIQKARFQDRVKLISVFDDDALDQLIPCLTLQPLLENAFVHGIESMESGAELQLIVERFPSFVQITISDNGAGMTEQVLQSMLTLNESTVKGFSGSNRTRNSTGLGTQNVFRRLVLFYGKDADEGTLNRLIKIQSAENMGTSIILTLPYRNKE